LFDCLPPESGRTGVAAGVLTTGEGVGGPPGDRTGVADARAKSAKLIIIFWIEGMVASGYM